MTTPLTPRNIKMSDELWDAAKLSADKRAISVSEFVRRSIANEIARLALEASNDPMNRYTGEPQ